MPQEVLYSVIGVLASTIGVLVAWGYKGMVRAIQEVSAKVDLFLAGQAACQTQNARTYATKEELREVWHSVDEHGKDIANIKGKLE
jgi:uncharacterized protein (DUF736 family)